jgi:hypothetical protein
MKRFVAFCFFLTLAFPALAVEGSHVMYIGGTAPGTDAGIVGHLDTTSDTALIFEHSGSKLSIPYDAIQSFDYSKEVTRHLGVLPAIGVGLVKMRQHRHFFRISYRDSGNVAQVAIFEVPKQMPRTLQAVLQTRSPQSCKPRSPRRKHY